MNNENLTSGQIDQGYYIYSDKKFQGPFELSQIERMVLQKVITSEATIWEPLQKKWFKISDLITTIIPVVTVPQIEPASARRAKPKTIPSDEFWKNIQSKLDFVESEAETQAKSVPNKKELLLKGLTTTKGLGLAAFFVISFFIAINAFNSKPELFLKELSDTDNRELSAAINADTASGPAATVALIPANIRFPQFIIGTNQADSEILKVKIEGLPETLLQAFQFSVETKGQPVGGLLRTQNLSYGLDSPLPKGYYRVQVFSSSQSMPMVEKIYFLGGVKDQKYDQSLISYHAQLQKKAKNEINEFTEIIETINSELDTYYQNLLSTQRSTYYSSVLSQVQSSVLAWEIKRKDGDVFHAEILLSIVKLSQTLQANISKLNADRSRWVNHLVSNYSLIRSQLLTIQSQLLEVDRLPVTSNGFPQKKSLSKTVAIGQ